MPRKKTVLSANEWKLMQVLWESDGPLSIAEIAQKLGDSVSWAITTYQSQIERLMRGGYVECERHGRMRLFHPAIDMQRCIQEEQLNLREKMPAEASAQLVLGLLRDAGSISHEQAQDLRRLIDELEETEERND